MSTPKTAITPTRAEDFAEWYQQVVKGADLAENSPVRGCMVIKPWGYALWESMQRELDAMFKATGHKNAYFPLLIPLSLLEKEAAHVEGFAKECAVVTHHRLIPDGKGGLIPDPTAKLEEPFIIRPTSETIIGEMYAGWVQSYRDLPILINQWANVMRWELRTRMFLRTSEFLWQEGHTAHETADEAQEETMKMLDVYARFAEDYMAMPVFRGRKSESERFPGAVETYCIEAMMGDRKAIQAGTSHFLGQNFAKASGIKYLSREGKEEHAWTTSWGVSTRLIGGLIMTHGDDDGLIMPPRLAPAHVVILPIMRDESRAVVEDYVAKIASALRAAQYDGRPVIVEVDNRDVRERKWDWVKKGAPIRVEIGPRDAERGTVSFARRDEASTEKRDVPHAELPALVPQVLAEIQQTLFDRAVAYRAANMRAIGTMEEFRAFFASDGGFAVSAWCGGAACETQIREELKVTIRCLPMDPVEDGGFTACIVCGAAKIETAIFAKNY